MNTSLFIEGNNLKKEISQLAWKENLTDEERLKLMKLSERFNDLIKTAGVDLLYTLSESFKTQLGTNDENIESSVNSLKWNYNGFKYSLSNWETVEFYD